MKHLTERRRNEAGSHSKYGSNTTVFDMIEQPHLVRFGLNYLYMPKLHDAWSLFKSLSCWIYLS